ncbi:hypothetical protein PM082_009799 [Marasmius tenuissimus]|nr:hypothetical protein PM082_009799 [Marasmius tenuissimus]
MTDSDLLGDTRAQGLLATLAYLPFCPSKQDLAREAQYIDATALPFHDSDSLEEFHLEDSDFGKTSISDVGLRSRIPRAPTNYRVSPTLFPFHDIQENKELDGELFGIPETRNMEQLKATYNFIRINTRICVRHSVRHHRKLKDLRWMLELPEDLILEILSHLHPIDLHALRVVNRQFRTFLTSPTSNPLWRHTFGFAWTTGEPDTDTIPIETPQCPADLNGWEWARLLFGAPVCDVCGMIRSDTKPNAAFRKRLCYPCLQVRMNILRDELRTPFPFESNTLTEEMKRYKSDRRRYIDGQAVYIHQLVAWEARMKKWFTLTVSKRYKYKVKSILNCLHRDSEGSYTLKEISYATYHIRIFVEQELSPRYTHVTTHVPRYERLPRSKWNRNKELQAVLHLIIQSRRTCKHRELILRLINSVRDRLWAGGDSDVKYWPPSKMLAREMSPFKELGELDLSRDALRLACEEATAQIPTVVNEWLAGVEEHLTKETGGGEETLDLTLATSIFRCRASGECGQGTRLIGLEGVVDHLRNPTCPIYGHRYRFHLGEISRWIRFCRTASRMVFGILEMLGLDASRTLAEDMDDRGDRFRCLSCSGTPEAGYDWRKAVVHQESCHFRRLIRWEVM